MLSRHTWADRAHTLVDRAGGPARQPDRSVSAVVPTRRPAQLDHVVDTLAAQVDVPVQLVGYGLVVGLDGTGDRALGSAQGGGPTVRSVANLLRNLGVDAVQQVAGGDSHGADATHRSL